MCGGFTAFRLFTSEEKELFVKILDPIVGVDYLPLAVATQVVAGTNYAFLCESKVVRPDSLSYNSLVIIHKPLPHVNEAPSLMEIKTVKII
ncbi:MAG: hypothetical protein LBV71_19485 [Prevotella sp.]|nr:hypothetical protein [Prevotella sp.]